VVAASVKLRASCAGQVPLRLCASLSFLPCLMEGGLQAPAGPSGVRRANGHAVVEKPPRTTLKKTNFQGIGHWQESLRGMESLLPRDAP
jgi:hypothetical protein